MSYINCDYVGARPTILDIPGGTDTTGTPGDFTAESVAGKAAFSGASLTVTMTNRFATSTSTAMAIMASGNNRIMDVITIAAGSVTFRRSSGSTPNEPFYWWMRP